MFSSMMPQRREFFDLLAAHSDCGVAGANAVSMYNIGDSTAEARELASLSADACMRLNRAVIAPGHHPQAGGGLDTGDPRGGTDCGQLLAYVTPDFIGAKHD